MQRGKKRDELDGAGSPFGGHLNCLKGSSVQISLGVDKRDNVERAAAGEEAPPKRASIRLNRQQRSGQKLGGHNVQPYGKH